ncbi:MAG: lipid-A-disaccharide synthase [Gammaproteobacteria bacterium]
MTPDPGAAQRRVGMVAGETSGDLLAGAVLQGLRQADPAMACAGVGGPAMAAAGFDRWWDVSELSVLGYAEVLRAYPRLLRMRRALGDRLLDWRPDVFVGVDAPDFNLDLEARLREGGIRVVHFVSPSIWAWRGERIEKIRRSVDHMLLVFPFETEIYARAGIAATYVGHPLADAIPLHADCEGARLRLGLDAGRTTVALLPGSRAGEVKHMGQTFVRTAAWLHARRPELQFVLPAAGEALYERLQETIAAMRLPDGLRLTLVQGRSHEALAAADTVLVASGTATLETALFRKPMVIAYRMAWLSHRIMRKRGYLPWIGLPNILAGESLVPEFIQDRATPEAMGAALLAQLDDDAGRQRIAARFEAMHHELRRGCAQQAAAVLMELTDGPRARR